LFGEVGYGANNYPDSRCESGLRYRATVRFATNARHRSRILKAKLGYAEEVRLCPLTDEMPLVDKERMKYCARL
jgi:hypothetical protein